MNRDTPLQEPLLMSPRYCTAFLWVFGRVQPQFSSLVYGPLIRFLNDDFETLIDSHRHRVSQWPAWTTEYSKTSNIKQIRFAVSIQSTSKCPISENAAEHWRLSAGFTFELLKIIQACIAKENISIFKGRILGTGQIHDMIILHSFLNPQCEDDFELNDGDADAATSLVRQLSNTLNWVCHWFARRAWWYIDTSSIQVPSRLLRRRSRSCRYRFMKYQGDTGVGWCTKLRTD